MENILSRFKDKDNIPKDSIYAVARFAKACIIVVNVDKYYPKNFTLSRVLKKSIYA
ncbi:hypothetical protein HMPREF1142_1146 [Peptostreptococcaceae bacterium AS15]|nr:hypothetical protein HMPREF1142_1146 [Peptostreptococcaceae bacterium AS15]